MISPNFNYKKVFLFGFCALPYGRSDAEGLPSDPYHLRAQRGPSSYADVRHRVVPGTNLPHLWKFSISPFVTASGGAP